MSQPTDRDPLLSADIDAPETTSTFAIRALCALWPLLLIVGTIVAAALLTRGTS